MCKLMLNILIYLNQININKRLSNKFNVFLKIHTNRALFNNLLTIYNNILTNSIKTSDSFSNNASVYLIITNFVSVWFIYETLSFLQVTFILFYSV